MSGRMLSAVAGLLLGLSGSAGAAVYNCLPVDLLEFPDRFSTQCAAPVGAEGWYPRDGADRIRFFAVPKSEVDLAKRFVYVVQTALTAGVVVQFQYTSGDLSGSAFGCLAGDCRRPLSFGLLAPATDVRIPYARWPSGATETIAGGQWVHYGPFSISGYRKLVVNLTGTGNADLYVRQDDPPTESAYVCRPLLSGSNESCTIPGPADPLQGATYFVAVRGASASSQYTLSVSIQSK